MNNHLFWNRFVWLCSESLILFLVVSYFTQFLVLYFLVCFIGSWMVVMYDVRYINQSKKNSKTNSYVIRRALRCVSTVLFFFLFSFSAFNSVHFSLYFVKYTKKTMPLFEIRTISIKQASRSRLNKQFSNVLEL